MKNIGRSFTACALASALSAVTLSGCMTLTPPPAADTPRILGHRGTRGEYQENCAEAVSLALANGIVGFETDIRMTQDGHLVIMHDARVERVSDGKGIVEDLTLAELKRCRLSHSSDRIPTLEEMLSPLKGRKDIFIELEMKSSPITKNGRLDEYLDKAYATATRMLEPGTYAFTSFDEKYLSRMRALHPDAPIGLIRAKPISEDLIARAKELGCQRIAPLLNGATREFVDRAHAEGLAVTLWMVQTGEAWEAAQDVGADCVTSDYPILLRREVLGMRKRVVAIDAALAPHGQADEIGRKNQAALKALARRYECVMVATDGVTPPGADRTDKAIEIIGGDSSGCDAHALVLDWAKRRGCGAEDVVFVGGDFADGGACCSVRANGMDHIVVESAKNFTNAVAVLLK